ncbi:MAG TPA: ATP synthase subunit I [Burkholderiaceae bacterium]
MQLALTIAAALAAGLALGALYFGALWQTLARLPGARSPGLLMAASLLGRIAVLLAGLLLLARWGGWLALGCALAGIVVARTLVLRRVGPKSGAPGRPA